jgi:hypothetical protein
MNNFKKISTKEESIKFEATVDMNTKINEILNLLADFKSDSSNLEQSKESTNKKSAVSVEQFRTDKRKSISFDNSMQLSNLTINDVFEDKPNIVNFNSNDKSKRLNFNQNIQMIIEEDSNLNTLTYNHNRNAFQQLKSELDCNFFEENTAENFREIDHQAIQKEIHLKFNQEGNESQKKKSKKIVEFYSVSKQISGQENLFPECLPQNEKNSLIFYNLLFVAQTNNMKLFQDKPFGNLILSSK